MTCIATSKYNDFNADVITYNRTCGIIIKIQHHPWDPVDVNTLKPWLIPKFYMY